MAESENDTNTKHKKGLGDQVAEAPMVAFDDYDALRSPVRSSLCWSCSTSVPPCVGRF